MDEHDDIAALLAQTAQQNASLRAEIDARREAQRTQAREAVAALEARRAMSLRARRELEQAVARHPEWLVSSRVIRRRIAFGITLGTFVASAVALSGTPWVWLLWLGSVPALAWVNWLRAQRKGARDDEQ